MVLMKSTCCVQAEAESRRTEDVEAQQRTPGAPGQLPSAPSSRPDGAATPRGIGRPPVRDHNMLMHGVRRTQTYPHATPPCSLKNWSC